MFGSFHDFFASRRTGQLLLSVVLLISFPSACYAKFLELSLPSPALEYFDKAGGIGMPTSVIGIAWGPWNSPEIQAMSNKNSASGYQAVDSDRTYALAIHIRKTHSSAYSKFAVPDFRIVRVLNVDGEKELSSAIDAKGFVGPGTAFAKFENEPKSEYWAFFPVPPNQSEFLFELKGESIQPFLVQVKNDRLVFIDLTKSPTDPPTPEIEKNYTGKIGSENEVHFHLKLKGTNISGKETRTGATEAFILSGTVSAAGSIQLKEENGRKILTGLFKGRSEDGLRTIKGYFSKPDGSGLLPFSATLDSPKTPTSIPARDNL